MSNIVCMCVCAILTYILFHFRENGLEGGSAVWTEVPASLYDTAESVTREERERVEIAAADTPDDTLSCHILEWLTQ